jgi:hypothetical protein
MVLFCNTCNKCLCWRNFITKHGLLPPIQDTGLITAVSEGGQDISPERMMRLQRELGDCRSGTQKRFSMICSVDGCTCCSPTPPASIEYIRASKLRALAMTTSTRSELLPDIPTVGEFVRGYESSIWWATRAS